MEPKDNDKVAENIQTEIFTKYVGCFVNSLARQRRGHVFEYNNDFLAKATDLVKQAVKGPIEKFDCPKNNTLPGGAMLDRRVGIQYDSNVCWTVEIIGKEIIAKPNWVSTIQSNLIDSNTPTPFTNKVLGSLPENIMDFIPHRIAFIISERVRNGYMISKYGFQTEVVEWRRKLLAEIQVAM